MTKETAPSDECPRLALHNGIVDAVVYPPDLHAGYYRGTRFDWAGVLANVMFGGHNYFPQWFSRMDPGVVDFVYDGDDIVAGPCTAATGPVEEFVACGFNEAAPGQSFLKIGVGILRRPDADEYRIFRLYDIVNAGTRALNRHGEAGVQFLHELADKETGYGYSYRKTVELLKGEPRLTLAHSLRNTGSRPIETSVYDHNFLSMDSQAAGPGTKIIFRSPPPVIALDAAGLAKVDGNCISFPRTLAGTDCAQVQLGGFAELADYDIRIENADIGVGVQITGDRAISRAPLWAIRASLSIEPYIAVQVAPGDEFQWTLTYRFYAL
jgi:hypothetical protein